MNKQTIKWLLFLFVVLLAASLACGELADDDDDDNSFEETFCKDGLGFNHTFHWDEKVSPTTCNFSGKVTNTASIYAHNVSFKVVFSLTPSEISCPFHFDEIAPGATVEALCQFTADNCFYNARIMEDSCEFLDYAEHLDWLTNQEKEDGQEPETVEETLPDNMTLEEISQLLVPVLDEVDREWTNKVKEHPCQPDQADAAYSTWVYEKAKALSDANVQLVGEGKPWATLEAFRDWLITESDRDENEIVTKTWSGTFELSTVPTINCGVCVPPGFNGSIEFSTPLDTCVLNGKINGSGSGSDVRASCDENNPLPCSGVGSYMLDATLTGTVDKNGVLTLTEISGIYKGSVTWEGSGCSGGTGTINNSNLERTYSITGNLNWSGAASGNITDTSGKMCAHNGTWTAQPVENP